MTVNSPAPKYRSDYTVPDYVIDTISLTFQLFKDHTVVTAVSNLHQHPDAADTVPLRLHGENLTLRQVQLDGATLSPGQYSVDDQFLEIPDIPHHCTLTVVTEIDPAGNSSLEGLYKSSGNYCTQCEAEGFRKITYFLDRPDVMAKFTTRIEGDEKSCPVMLSNGNMIDHGKLEHGRHFVVWQDPYPKPSYLFALVAGDLVSIEDEFVTCSGNHVALQFYVEERNKDKCDHAMESLKKSMRWDEEVYGLEYDLDIYMVVAVDDFNMGAMENKGLNIFNSKYVLATPETATDVDYMGIEGVIGHEYFHNWTGNRVTCRDWFQLSLKEGLTVFRDQEFSSDMNSRAVKRIDDVRILRTHQFREDAGPMAHPVRPDSYVEINNFYTVTVYNKGAEVIRMMHSLLGPTGFRKGMDTYFARHDGQAVTCDDFVAAMEAASGVDLLQFRNWYGLAGTPEIEVLEQWDDQNNSYALTLRQIPSQYARTSDDPWYHIPVAIGLLDKSGSNILEDKDGRGGCIGGTQVLELHKEQQTFVFDDMKEKPVLSLLRNFSAPVHVQSFHPRGELAFLMAHDTDLFNRWDASMQLAESIILETVTTLQRNGIPKLDPLFVEAVKTNLVDPKNDKALVAKALLLPDEAYLAQRMDVVDPDALHQARQFVKTELARQLKKHFLDCYQRNEELGSYEISPAAIGKRSLKNICLDYLMSGEVSGQEHLQLCTDQFSQSTNMTDTIAALTAVVNHDVAERRTLLQSFYDQWKHDPLVMDKWLILQATSRLEDTLDHVKKLMDDPVFSISNPNKVRSLLGAFCANHVRFNCASGAGYRFMAEQIVKLNGINPQIAARLVTPFTTWKRYDAARQHLLKKELTLLAETEGLSPDVYEIVTKSM